MKKIHTYDILNYKIYISFDEENNKEIVNCFVTLKNLKEKQRRISFVIANRPLEIKEIKLNDKQLKYNLKSLFNVMQQLSVIFEEPIKKDKIISLEFNYAAVFAITGGTLPYGYIGTGYVDFIGESFWYPMMFNDLFSYELFVEVNQDEVAISKGKLVEIKSKDSKKIYHYKSIEDKPSIWLYVRKLPKFQKKYKNIILTAYFDKEYEKLIPIMLFDTTYSILNFYQKIFGGRLPDEFTLVQVGSIEGGGWFGGRYNTAITGDTLKGSMKFLEILVKMEIPITGLAHELGHGWWGDDICYKEFYPGGPFLNEGFAQYSEYLYSEYKYGKKITEDFFMGFRFSDWYLNEPKKKIPVGEFSTADSMDYDVKLAIVYCKGSWILHMFRYVVGDKTFFKIMKEYYNKFKYKLVLLSDFENVIKENYKGDIDWFLKQWLYSTKELDYAIKEVKEKNDGTLEITVENLGEIEMKVPIEILIKTDKEKKLIKTDLSQKESRIIFKPKGKVKEIIVDPNYWLYDIKRENNYYPEVVGYSLGKIYSRVLNLKEMEELNLPKENLVLHVTEVDKNSPAEKAGLKSGDIILGIDGKSIDKNLKLSGTDIYVGKYLWHKHIGDEIIYEILRDGKKEIIKCKLEK